VAVREPEVSPRTRRGVYAFLLVFTIAGIAHLELYPFSGFRLFSEVRGEARTSWELRAVDGRGQEIPIDVDRLPLGYRQAKRLIPTMDDLDAHERDELCDAWTTPLRESGVDVARLRIYRTVESVRPDGPPGVRELQYECGGTPP
jgi:hypothetical protein